MILIIFVDTKNVSSACWVLTFQRTYTPHVFSVWNICFRLSFTHESSQVVILWNQLTDEIRPHAASWSWPWRFETKRVDVCWFQNTKSSVFSWVFLPMVFFVVWREKQYVCVFLLCVCVVRCHIWIYQVITMLHGHGIESRWINL